MVQPYSGLGTTDPRTNPCGSGYVWDAEESMCIPTDDRVKGAQDMLAFIEYLKGNSTKQTTQSQKSGIDWTSPWILGGIAVVAILALRGRG